MVRQGRIEKRFAVLIGQQVENDQDGWRFGGQSAHSGRGGMDALEQRIERESAALGDGNLAVERELVRL